MGNTTKENIIFESNAKYNNKNVLLELNKDNLLFKKKKLFSNDYKIIEKLVLKDIIIDNDCISVSQDKELITIHLNYAVVELLFNSMDVARQLKDAIIDILTGNIKVKNSKKKDK